MNEMIIISGLVFSGALLLGNTVHSLKHSTQPLSNTLAFLTGTAGGISLSLTVVVSYDPTGPLVSGVAVLAGFLLPVPWSLFAFRYTGYDDLLTFNTVAAATVLPCVGVVATVIIYASQLSSAIRLPSQATAEGILSTVVAVLNLVQWVGLLYSGGLVVIATGIVLWTFRRYSHLNWIDGTLICATGLIPWIAILFGLQIETTANFALPTMAAVGLVACSLAATAAVVPQRLLSSAPTAGSIGPATVIDELEDAVFVTDRDGTVIKTNDAGSELIDSSSQGVIGSDITQLLQASLSALDENETLKLHTEDGNLWFAPSVSEITDQHGRPIGTSIFLRDVTDQITRQQRLQVFNRVFRHHIGNDMTVVLGHAQQLRGGVDDPGLAAGADAIYRTGMYLTNLSETAREVERILGTDDSIDGLSIENRTFCLSDMISSIIEDVSGGNPDADITYQGSEELCIQTDRERIRLALHHLIENGIEHNDSDNPSVDVTATCDATAEYPLKVRVSDNGPGIPDNERIIIEEGIETQLQHGSGLGLWAVRWSIVQLGGQVHFDDNSSGTSIVLKLPTELCD